MQNEIVKIMKEYGDTVSVYAKNLSDNKVLVSHRCNKVFRSPTVMKIMVMVEALKEVEEGHNTLDDRIEIKETGISYLSLIRDLSISSYTLKDLIILMMTANDYTAINTLLNLFGLEKINNRIDKMGLLDTKVQRKMLDFYAIEKGKDNVTSIRDMSNILERIYNRSVFKYREISDFSVEMLKYQRVGRGVRNYIPEWESTYRSGEVGDFYHDIGIVFLENAHYILGVFVDDALDPLEALEIISRVKKAFLKNVSRKSDVS
ncbi:serine hydrolase [Ilyobacter polytropus]|uniref:NLP/P60 protein n=1 Tax=Ilyobacter polytropus (strain ATCC 51220 / DSM 2926 / LMG 16218 / CuHBu1) TaxID=572544 RepID=E3HAM4_ILYPC|nr:serine hydrolase [Ilyobacter polytropus]ADO83211.1 NLP/P60 protein [Ilyobacter polytropus DSM 2926]